MTGASFEPTHVELAYAGTLANGDRLYTVDFVEANGARAGAWDGPDLDEARQAARECGDCGQGVTLPVIDLTGGAPVEIAAGTVH